ncbi:MAG: peptide chain release factor N(5)-glutamine methyltransferase [Winogradskyella sp.]|nr:peptide chain release factor N(5)-glutamine methyltransferase [Winogradskyella sp.]
MKIRDIQHIYHKELDHIFGRQEVDSMFYLLTEALYNVPRFHLALNPEYSISKSEQEPIFSALDKLKQEVPVQYIIGHTQFYDCQIEVTPAVLIPRPETEELVSWIIDTVDKNTPIKILDIGTGSGCISVALAKSLPNADVYALDVSIEALNIAKTNAKNNNVDIHFIENDILANNGILISDIPNKWDVIVSNPPYVRQLEKQNMSKNVLHYEPDIALFVSDENPLDFYSAICDFSRNYLKKGGFLFFEINQYLGDELTTLLDKNNYTDIELRKDSSGNNRMIKAIKSTL